jgi:hypothetical protein
MSELCKVCHTPSSLTAENVWLDNGDIVQKRDQRHRVVFIESENMDPLFQGIERIIGVPIEHIVINCVRKTLRSYLSLFISDRVREQVRKKELSLKAMDDGFRELAKAVGSGRYEFVDMRHEGNQDDYFAVSVREPYSVPMCAAGHAAAIESILGYDHGVSYTQIEPGVYEIIAFPSAHPQEFKGRMSSGHYQRNQGGDIELERCEGCGGPKALASYRWFKDRGIIVNESTKRRMALMSNDELDPIFEELEYELGDTIPRVVVEAQRLFTRTGFYSMEDVTDGGDFRTQLALRGLGNLKEIDVRRKGAGLLIENAVLPLMIVGMMQGVFEMAFDLESDVDWEYTDQRDLRMEISPRSVMSQVDFTM